MPELPEVEVCRRGIEPHILNQQVSDVIVRNANMRWPITPTISDICGETIRSVTRRAKYLLLETSKGILMIHLGMSGTIRVIDKATAVTKHDHFDLVLTNGLALRLNDPRRFGSVLWVTEDINEHKLLKSLGPEPLSSDFTDECLYERSRNKIVPIKTFLMNNNIVVGVGNIYANESLFKAGIDPRKQAGKVSKKRYIELTRHIKQTLAHAIEQGGTTLKDFTQSDGKPGYFAQELQVYGRSGEPCFVCKGILKEIKQAGRATVYCPNCQKK
ncbi:bifunctional DNA-formamidopyrimidine glycosylase/DNA-(apurinic or apyrimidinic site) lyase [Colwellia sp. E2M01]|uniref:bifunctional DNA-formamidopyrimidine glycosylase/DNA-(apurinic or apyrimidinic site) lyase n=1 Tax=Colwellia sp. E2M01 TaxID=2841561 RepID=UPI001C09B3B2|nr:bifunctional DNA-formamidopyrimidine glycosylase/DNA-(apurinic or apyrimidinic site) lyase [Colwellia sp. E2M01]MBU2869540.1 bifunctional DNA-formamidopyrimidine glycosylase/DNA-(apurinic or apyrimidinic site) lyase [Colwellia sp. E2M01]